MNAPMTPTAPAAVVDATPSPFERRLRLRPAQLAVGLGLGLAFELLIDGARFGLGHLVFASLVALAIGLEGRTEGWQRAGSQRWVLLGAVALLGSTCLHSATWLAVLSTLAAVLLVGIAMQGWTGERALSTLRTGQLLGWPFKTVGQAGYAGAIATSNGLEHLRINQLASAYGPSALRLFFVVVPPAGVLLLLLSSGDAVFRSKLAALETALFGFELGGVVRGGFVTALFGVLFAGLITFSNRRREGVTASEPRRVLRATEALTLLGTLTSLLLAFGLTATPCALAPSSCELPAGVTFSDAAHEGFFQLLTAAIGILVLLMALPARTALESKGSQRAFTALSTALVLASMPMVVSAVARLWRYETAYGLTVLRLMAYSGLALVSLVLAWRAVTLWKWQHAFVPGALAAATVTLLALSVLQPEAFIARRNLARGNVDLDYLRTLSEEATPALISYGYRPVVDSSRPDRWIEWNRGRAQAAEVLSLCDADCLAVLEAPPHRPDFIW